MKYKAVLLSGVSSCCNQKLLDQTCMIDVVFYRAGDEFCFLQMQPAAFAIRSFLFCVCLYISH